MPRPLTDTARWPRWLRLAVTLLRATALVPAAVLIYWSGRILDNIWTLTDSGALTYLVYAAVPGLPGALLLCFAVGGPGYWRWWP